MTAQTLLLLAASTVSLVWWIPQLVRVMGRSGVGVSVETWALSAANLAIWGLWALVTGHLVVVAVEWVQAAGSVAVVIRAGVTRRAVVVALAVGMVAVASYGWPLTASVAAVGSVIAVRLPQLWVVVRARDGHAVAQVSALAWALSASSNLLWLAWALSGRVWTMVVGASLSVALSGAIAVMTRRRMADGSPARVARRGQGAR